MEGPLHHRRPTPFPYFTRKADSSKMSYDGNLRPAATSGHRLWKIELENVIALAFSS